MITLSAFTATEIGKSRIVRIVEGMDDASSMKIKQPLERFRAHIYVYISLRIEGALMFAA